MATDEGPHRAAAPDTSGSTLLISMLPNTAAEEGPMASKPRAEKQKEWIGGEVEEERGDRKRN